MMATKSETFAERQARFKAMAQSDGFAAQLSHSGVTNSGDDHDSETILERSKRVVDETMKALFDASINLVKR